MNNRAHAAYRSYQNAQGQGAMVKDRGAEGQGGEQLVKMDRDQAILAEMPQVYLIAARIHERLPASVQLEDLVSAGAIGLMEAYDKFKPGRDAQFSTFARFRIRGAILDSLRSLDWGSRTIRRRAREIADTSQKLEGTLGRKPEKEEIAAEMKISLDQLETAIRHIDSLQIVGQQAASSAEPGETYDLIENAVSHEKDPFELYVRGEQKRQLVAALGELNEREQLVLSLYYREELTMKEVSEVIGVALSRVSQIHQAAIGKLRKSLEEAERRPVASARKPLAGAMPPVTESVPVGVRTAQRPGPAAGAGARR